MTINVVNVAEIAPDGWNFVEDFFTPNQFNWRYFSANPKNFIERKVSKPKIGRYRACLQGSLALEQRDDLVISHLPRTTHWQSKTMSLMGKAHRHLAFSFNFTKLPGARTQRAMIKTFKNVDDFVVFSQYEKKIYSDFFSIPESKIHHLHWAMNLPLVDENYECPKDYYCAVGGEGRDYNTLIECFRDLSHLKLVIVTRPGTIDNGSLPGNITVSYNLESRQFWSVVKHSKAVIVPLLNDDTACGHITLVGAMQFGKPIVSTYSKGTTDYIQHEHTGLLAPHGIKTSLRDTIERLESSPELQAKIAENGLTFTSEYCAPQIWARFVSEYLQTHSPK